ncbi:MAG: phage tail tape measure protein [Anaeromicrobium sp.]|uniref:phage tail tape measure protein n=1 Tax=Anaeromicrobium sp. TaxID=1929132 RepID=UPI0025DCFADD|nr:phage tail tape measure protein [Anaeromicrobium sp.]MCT4593185.1 phage tail tape measure protein [Anaeromicrobium sp.]
MAQREIYRLDINVGVSGDEQSRRRLRSLDRYTEQSERRLRRLNRIRASPSVRLRDRLSRPLDRVESKISKFSKVARSKLLAVATAGAVLVGGLGVGSTLKTFMDFEQGMKNVQATSQATTQEFEQLWGNAKQLGATTAFSAKEASDGMNYLAMAGFKTNQIIKAMPGLLDLAAASGTDLATTSDIVSDAITAFGLKAKDTTHLSDVMAKASSTANTNVQMLGESFKYAASPATAFGMSAEETTTALAMMANAGIKGSMAGNALRGALTRLAKPPRMASKWLDKLGISIADSHGKIKPFNSIMDDMRKKMSKLTQQERQQAVASIFGQEAMSGMLAVLNTSTEKFDTYIDMLESADGAAKEMANTKLDSLGGQFTILKSAVEGMKIELGERLAPYAKEFVTWFTDKIPDITKGIIAVVDTISNLAHGFSELSPATKKFILGITVGTLAMGPFLKTVNGITMGISGLMKLGSGVGSFFGLFKGATVAAEATTAVATSAEVATGSISGFGIAARSGTLLLNPWVLGIGAATIAGIKLYTHLKKDAIPKVELFGEETSRATKKAIGAYLELERKATTSLNQIQWSGAKVTQEMKDTVVNNFNAMATQITTKLDETKNKSMSTLQKMISNSKGVSDEEKQQLIATTEEAFKSKEEIINNGMTRIEEIYSNAAAENRKIKQEEYNEILRIKSEMSSAAIQIMSETEAEHAAILEKMRANASILTAQQAADVVKNSLEQKEKTIAAAQQEFDTRMKLAAMMRSLGGEKNESTADWIIQEATRQKDEVASRAEEMHSRVVEQAKQQAKEHVTEVDWETGQILSNFDAMIEKAKEFYKLTAKEQFISVTQSINSAFEKQSNKGLGNYTGPGSIPNIRLEKDYANGTNYATSGIHQVAEHGFEIVTSRQHRLFNGGEKVLNHRKSKKLLSDMLRENSEVDGVQKQQFSVARPTVAGVGGISVNVGDIDVQNEFDSDVDIDGIIDETVKQVAYKLREAFKNIKR